MSWDSGNSGGWGSSGSGGSGSGWGSSASNSGSGWGNVGTDNAGSGGWGGSTTSDYGTGASDYLSSSNSWDDAVNPITPDAGTVTWLPAWLALGSALLAIGALWRAFSLEAANSKITFGIVAYILGALGASILFNWQRAKEIQGRSAGKRQKYLGNISGVNLATAAMVIGLLAAIAAAVIVATEWARY